MKNLVLALISICLCFTSISYVMAGGHSWKKKQIADAMLAAPPVVTESATIYGWDPTNKGQMTLLRLGSGPYTCMATGFGSLRIGKPLEPIPGPICADQNAWAFLKAVLNEKNPMKPSKPYPTAPGMAWMMAGMGVSQGMIDMGSGEKVEMFKTEGGPSMTKVTPHIMIMPLPINKSGSMMSKKYDPSNPEGSWIMAAGSAFEHLMVHFSEKHAEAVMTGSK